MFSDWSEFYLLAGSAAAVLIGLIFVVVTLMQDRSRSSVMAGSKLYMGPVVLQVSFVLALSGAALIPDVRPGAMGIVTGVVAIWGFYRGVQSIVGINALKGEDKPHWTDVWFYGVIPTALSIALALIAWGFESLADWAINGVAAAIMIILLLAIRNEWDLVTWLAPRPDK